MSFEDLRRSLAASQASRPAEVAQPVKQDLYPVDDLGRDSGRFSLKDRVRNGLAIIHTQAPKPISALIPLPSGPQGLRFYTAPGTHTPVCVLHGPGGTGKTYKIREYAEQNEHENVLMTATTGVAAINIGPGCVTVNSAFKYFDEDSLREAIDRRYEMIAREIRGYSLIVIDEMSMLSSTTLDMIYGFIESLNRSLAAEDQKIKLLLSGDFCQLPPISRKGFAAAGVERKRNEAVPFAFKSSVWPKAFEPAVTKLEKNFRQSGDEKFQQALKMCRIGNAAGCVAMLESEYAGTVDMNFQGLTMYPINKDVDSHNERKLRDIVEPAIALKADLWGTPHRDWKDLQEPVNIKLTAQVRVTANDTPNFEYVNGDIGTLLELPGLENTTPSTSPMAARPRAKVRLHRNNAEVSVVPVTRLNTKLPVPGEMPPSSCNGHLVPKSWNGPDAFSYQAYVAANHRARLPYWDPKMRKWIIGVITYMPLTLGWAGTVHKAQGLTAVGLQIDISNQFAAQPQMMYVALSRCREARNIRIARGDQAKLASRIRAHPDVIRFV